MKIPEQMKAAVLMAPNRLELHQAKTPSPGKAEVLIRVEACALCPSDVSLISKPWKGQPPFGEFIPGHEYSGTVAALGETVDEFKVGDRVFVESHLGCMRCLNCRRGYYTACLNYGNLRKGHRANGFTTNGGYAQYVVNHINTVHPLPEKASFEEGALMTNLGCVLYGYQSVGGYVAGESVAVIGPGALGLIAVQVAKLLGAGWIGLVGTRKERLALGEIFGADITLPVSEGDPAARMVEETGGIGVDLAIEASGTEEGLYTAVRSCRSMGKILLLGFPTEPVKLDLGTMGKKNISLYTVRGEGRGNCARAAVLVKNRKIDLRPLATHSFPLERIEEAFHTFIHRIDGAIKVILKPQEV